MLVAQPRRLAAVGMAERVAEEGGYPAVETSDVGYHIKGTRVVGPKASTVFVTYSVLLRGLRADAELTGVDMVRLCTRLQGLSGLLVKSHRGVGKGGKVGKVVNAG